MRLTPQPWGEAHEWLSSEEGQEWSREHHRDVFDHQWNWQIPGTARFFFSLKSSQETGIWKKPWQHPKEMPWDLAMKFHVGSDAEEIAKLSSPA